MIDNKVLVIDSNCLCYMSRFAFGGLSYEEKKTGVIFGFLGQIFRLAKKFDTNKFVFAWDSRKSFRQQSYPAYKRNRRKDRTKEEEIDDRIAFSQFGDLRLGVLPWMGFRNIFIQTGHEADDIIASVVMNNPDYDFTVVSSDNDLLQLLDYCDMYHPRKKTSTTKKSFMEKWGMEPNQWADVKSLAGCSTDNVPGIKGVGEKTAIKFIRGELKKGKIYERIISDEGKKTTEETQWFVALPLDTTKEYIIDFSNEIFYSDYFVEVFQEFGFNSFLKKENYESWKRRFNLQ